MARRIRWPRDMAVQNVSSLSRPDKTARITECVQRYWIDKGYSCHPEIGLERGGRLRADVLCLNTKANIVACEVKSCIADFRTDKKWHKYLNYCNKFYFAVDAHFWSVHQEELEQQAKQYGAGIIRVSNSGGCSVVQNAKSRDIDKSILGSLLVRMAWRGGRFGKE